MEQQLLLQANKTARCQKVEWQKKSLFLLLFSFLPQKFTFWCDILKRTESTAGISITLFNSRSLLSCIKPKDVLSMSNKGRLSSAKDIRLPHQYNWSADVFTVSKASTKTELQWSNIAGDTVDWAWQLNQTIYRGKQRWLLRETRSFFLWKQQERMLDEARDLGSII